MRERYEISIEILDAAFPASSWQRAYGDVLTGAAISTLATEWHWKERSWGLILEIAFRDEFSYEAWRRVPAVVSALDAVPDPVNGLLFHRGWGGTSGSGEPRRGRPLMGAGGAEIPIETEPDPVEAIAEPSGAGGGPHPARSAASA